MHSSNYFFFSEQRNSIETLKNIIINSAVDVYVSQRPEQFTLADLGCSSGPNTVTVAGEIIRKIGGHCHKFSITAPDFSVMLNDLPTNDFNTVFVNVPQFVESLKDYAGTDEWGHPSVFVAGVPGSFYGRLFPSRSVHFICSCSSLHWLSKVKSLLSIYCFSLFGVNINILKSLIMIYYSYHKHFIHYYIFFKVSEENYYYFLLIL